MPQSTGGDRPIAEAVGFVVGPCRAAPRPPRSPRRDEVADDVAFAVGMNGVGQQNEIALVDRIDPEHGAGETGVAEGGAAGEAVAAAAGVRRVDVEAISAAAVAVGQAWLAGHFLHSRLL